MDNYDDWHQGQLSQEMSAAVRANSVERLLAVLDKGADIHRWDGYMLTIALGYSEPWDSGSMVRAIADRMLGDKGIPTLAVLKSLGYTCSEMTKTARDICINNLIVESIDTDLPSDLSPFGMSDK